MSHSEQWNIQNIDAEALKKITQIAHEQGTNAGDFLNSLINNNHNHSKKILEKINQTLQDKTSPKDTVKNTVQNDLSKSLSDELEAYSEIVQKELQKTPLPSAQNTPPENKDVAPKSSIKPSTSDIKKNNTENNTGGNIVSKRTTKRTIKKTSLTDTAQKKSLQKQPEANLFKTLTQKIGIDNPVISQLSDTNITDTIMRERQLRDFMRIQMTEMRDIMGAMFEKKVEDKLQQFTNLLDITHHNQTSSTSFGSDVDFNDLLKTEDFNFKLALLADNIQTRILDTIGQELSTSITMLLNKNKEQSDYIIDTIKQSYDFISENIINQIENTIQQNLNTLSSQINPTSHESNTSLLELQENTSILSTRIENIENICSTLDNKLTQMHLDYVQHSQNTAHSDSNYHDTNTIKSELSEILKSVKESMKEATDTNNINQEKYSKNIVNTLKSVSDRLSSLEEIITDAPPAQATYLDSNPQKNAHNYHAYDFPNHEDETDDQLNSHKNSSSNILESEWDDNDTQTPTKSNFLIKQDSNDTDDNIRSFDRKFLLKDAGTNNSDKKNQSAGSNSMVKNLFKKLM